MENDILKVLITEEQIRRRVQELGVELTKDYEGKDPVIVGVLKGVVVFYADMIRQIKTPCQMDFTPEPHPPAVCRSNGTLPWTSGAAMC